MAVLKRTIFLTTVLICANVSATVSEGNINAVDNAAEVDNTGQADPKNTSQESIGPKKDNGKNISAIKSINNKPDNNSINKDKLSCANSSIANNKLLNPDETSGEIINKYKFFVHIDEKRYITKFSFVDIKNPEMMLCAEVESVGGGNFKLNVPGFTVPPFVHHNKSVKVYFNARKGISLKQNYEAIAYTLGLKSNSDSKPKFDDEFVELTNLSIEDIGKIVYVAFVGNAIKDIEFFGVDKT
jgi:hypothetical protein